MATTSRFSSACGLLLALCFAGTGCAARDVPPPVPAAPPPALPAPVEARSTADIVAAALPAVVLLIHEHPAKPGVPASTSFGAGFLTRENLVVTSLHVIEGEGKVSAMLYKPGRQSYTPMDGGLMRFLFENQSDLVAATQVAADAVTDLAVLRVDADTSQLPKLVWSERDPRAGDRVLALGHPQETVWSFSEGVVGALQYGILQHTAIVGPGSSGGPLLDAKGQVVGVNVAHVVNQPSGLSFARPMAIVASTFGDKKVASPLDQSTPAAAAISCWRAQELALSDTAECFDWEREWADYKSYAEEARRTAQSDDVRGKIARCHLGPEAKSAWLARAREHAIHVFDPEYRKAKQAAEQKQMASKGIAPGEKGGSVAVALSPAAPVDQGFLADYKDPARLAERLRNGLRVEQTSSVTADLAWVLLASRAADGTVAQFTELYARVGGRWVQRMSPSTEEMATLPIGWPSPPFTANTRRAVSVASILREAAAMDQCPFLPKTGDAATTSLGGTGRAVLRIGD